MIRAYGFTISNTGAVVKAHYTSTYIFEQNQRKIVHHLVKPITKDEVHGLFHLWNDTLDTLNANVATKWYAIQGILSTVSNVPFTNDNGIMDYFVAFLEKKPQESSLSLASGSGLPGDRKLAFMSPASWSSRLRHSTLLSTRLRSARERLSITICSRCRRSCPTPPLNPHRCPTAISFEPEGYILVDCRFQVNRSPAKYC